MKTKHFKAHCLILLVLNMQRCTYTLLSWDCICTHWKKLTYLCDVITNDAALVKEASL